MDQNNKKYTLLYFIIFSLFSMKLLLTLPSFNLDFIFNSIKFLKKKICQNFVVNDEWVLRLVDCSLLFLHLHSAAELVFPSILSPIAKLTQFRSTQRWFIIWRMLETEARFGLMLADQAFFKLWINVELNEIVSI